MARKPAAPQSRTQIRDSRLQAIVDHVTHDLERALREKEEQILDDLDRIKKEEDAGKFKVGISVTFDLNDYSLDTAVSYSLKTAVKATHQLDNPNQPSLPLET